MTEHHAEAPHVRPFRGEECQTCLLMARLVDAHRLAYELNRKMFTRAMATAGVKPDKHLFDPGDVKLMVMAMQTIELLLADKEVKFAIQRIRVRIDAGIVEGVTYGDIYKDHG